MHINRITSDGTVESLKDWDSWFSIINDDNEDYYVALSIGNKEEEIVITFDAKEYEDFKRTMAFTKRQLVQRIKDVRKLKRALDVEFKE